MNLFIDNLKFEKIMVYVGTHGKLVVSPLALQLNGHSCHTWWQSNQWSVCVVWAGYLCVCVSCSLLQSIDK